MPKPILPDPIALLSVALLARSETTTRVGTRVYARVHGTLYPQWRLSLVDTGENSDTSGGLSRLQMDLWGNGSTEADEAVVLEHARAIGSFARDLKGTYSPHGKIVCCSPVLFLSLPDEATGRARMVVDLELEAYPL